MKSIAIDGPAGAGKSTLARRAAHSLGFIYVDTGALYRTVGLYALRAGADTKNEAQIEPLLSDIKVDLDHINGEQHVFLNGEDVSDSIRTPEISMAASNVSALPSVRKFLFDVQRNMAKIHDVLMDGRDIGTVVLPDATVKIFLTASDIKRAERRYKELVEKGSDVTFDEVLSDLQKRDWQDTHREIAPLKPAADSVIIDTSDLTLDESAELIIKTIKERI